MAVMTRIIIASFVVLALSTVSAVASPEVPGAPQSGPIALVGGTVHPVSGPAIEGGIVLFDGGKLVAVGRDVAIPEKAQRVDVTGKHVYPGLIDANSQVGLVEVSSVRGSVDTSETGLVNPNVKAEVAVNPDSELIPVARAGGVLTVLTVPSGGLITGQSACMLLDGWSWEDMCLKSGVGLHITWPRMQPVEAWWVEENAGEQTEQRDRALKTIRTALADAKAYAKAKQAHADGKGAEPQYDTAGKRCCRCWPARFLCFLKRKTFRRFKRELGFSGPEGLRR